MTETTNPSTATPALPTPKPRRKPKKALLFSGVLCWLATLASIVFFAWLWRSYQWPPDYRWGLAIFGAMLFAGILVLLFSIKRIFFGPDRFSAMVGLVIGLLPLFLWPSLFADLFWRGTTRQNIYRGWHTDPAMFVISNIADAEAHYRYQRRTAGELVTLIDRGEPEDCSEVLKQMDEHVKSMTGLLEAKLDRAVYWVRGQILGQQGVSLAGWAVCGEPDKANELSYIDNHEVAHAVIGLLCPVDSNPPTLIIEGWAEYHSRDRADKRLQLLQAYADSDATPTLEQMVDDTWYGRSYGPAYDIGGPLVEYLIETEGGPKFFRLYKESRRSNFSSVFKSIYGTDWASVEPNFRNWLHEKHPDANITPRKLKPEEIDTQKFLAEITLSSKVNRSDWESLSSPLFSNFEKRFQQTRGSIAIDTLIKSQQTEEQGAMNPEGKSTSSVQVNRRVIVEEEEAWFADNTKTESFAMVHTPRATFRATRPPNSPQRKGVLIEEANEAKQLRDGIISFWRSYTLSSDLVFQLRRFKIEGFNVTIDEIIPGQDSIILLATMEKGDSDVEFKAELDPRHDYQMTRLTLVTTDAKGSKEETSEWKYESSDEQMIRLKSLDMTVKQPDRSIEEIHQRFASMNQSQERSFKDELQSIEIQPSDGGTPMPEWLVSLRWFVMGWGITSFVMMILYGLLRL